MSKFTFVVPILLALAGTAQAAPSPTVCFTPGADCQGLIVGEIGKARSEVLVQAYSFTSAPIAEALVAAKRRGVGVRVILDRSQRTEKYSGADYLANNGVPVQIDEEHAIAHNKLMIIDRITVVGGSFNYTKSAQERNAENVTVFSDSDFATKFVKNWVQHAEHSVPYVGRGSR